MHDFRNATAEHEIIGKTQKAISIDANIGSNVNKWKLDFSVSKTKHQIDSVTEQISHKYKIPMNMKLLSNFELHPQS